MNEQIKSLRGIIRWIKTTSNDAKPMLCSVCKSDEKVEFLTITDCHLCGKCQDELAEGFEQAMTMDRDDYLEL